MPKKAPNLAINKSYCFAFITYLFILLAPVLANGASTNSSQFIQYLTEEKLHLNQVIQGYTFPKPGNLEALRKSIEKNELKLSVINLKINNFQQTLQHQVKKKEDINIRITIAQQQYTSNTNLSTFKKQYALLENKRKLNNESIYLIKEILNLAKHYRNILYKAGRKLQLKESQLQFTEKLSNYEKKYKSLKDILSSLYEKNISLHRQIESNNQKFQSELEYFILINNHNIALVQHKLNFEKLNEVILKTHFDLMINKNKETFQKAIAIYRNVTSEYQDMIQSLVSLHQSISKEKSLINNSNISKRFNEIQEKINEQITITKDSQLKLNKSLINLKKSLSLKLAERQSISDSGFKTIYVIYTQIKNIPQKFFIYSGGYVNNLLNNYHWLAQLSLSILWSGLWIILLLAGILYYFLKSYTHDKEQNRLSAYLYYGVLTVFKRNLFLLAIITILFFASYVTKIPYQNYKLLTDLLIVWLIFRSLIIIAKLILLERVSDATGKDVRLYHRIRWLLITGGWTIALMILSHQLKLSLLMQDVLNRLFMLFILAISWVIWRSKDALRHILKPYLRKSKAYYRTSIQLLIFFLPITLLSTAIIGLLGYINLASTMSLYQAVFILILSGYILLRGLLADALEMVSELMINNLNNGWLWIEVFLKPLDKILKIILLIFTVFLFFQVFGLASNEQLMSQIYDITVYPIINLSGARITTLSVIEFLILLSVLIWAAKWTREFCYRWLFSNAKDSGIRNSLSVFSQYAVAIIGGILTLRVLGIDFSGLSYVLGGLAVGMGFGLRDFASNIIGGIMLLIERPVREGDLITIGNHEGRVEHIGIRSMRVRSWDNMEVLVPNAETFNKPFTNWTHQDFIVRSVISVKVNHSDDPVFIQQLILDVLAIIPELLSEPPPQVFLSHIDDGLIEFQVVFFINIEKYSRREINSKVFFAITAQFTAAGIKPPIPPHNVQLSDDGDYVIKKNPAEN